MSQSRFKTCWGGGGNYKTVKNNLEKFGIDTSHFTGQRWNKGLKFFEKTAIIPLGDILKPNVKYSSSVLRERLIACGLKLNNSL